MTTLELGWVLLVTSQLTLLISLIPQRLNPRHLYIALIWAVLGLGLLTVGMVELSQNLGEPAWPSAPLPFG